ncbi:hypothetical protein RJ639_011436 [Escallonia herrerae]|uniref:Glutathione S-transferase n=1 Tax=Escallonia herrerae TaxID=1293975 RepID=A0AA88VM10_9ASTE|nr:hypothetical protein RJ639_011436 [Escallonia herrerae]
MSSSTEPEISPAKYEFLHFLAKCVPAVMSTFSKVGEEHDKVAKEAREKNLECALEGKRFFRGEAIGFADIDIGWMGIWT